MALREVRDRLGKLWRVWDTRPSRPLAHGELAEGWLTFESENGLDRRRLTAIPHNWAVLPDDELLSLCRQAPIAPARKRLVE